MQAEQVLHAVSAQKPGLLDQVRETLRRKHYSSRTEEAYVDWIRRYTLFHHKRHPLEMAETEFGEFLNHLAVERRVAASTQNQALSALVFLYRPCFAKRSPRSTIWSGQNSLRDCQWC